MSTATLFESEVLPAAVRLRDYQSEAVTAIREQFEAGRRSTLLVLPTGCGKTITFGFLARNLAQLEGQRTLVLAHRGELIDQAANALGELGLSVGIEKAEHRAAAYADPHAVIATVQTMQRRRLESWPRDYFGLIVTDEAHHAVADSYQNIYRHFRGVPHLGVTATADRGDRINLGSVFESVAYEYTLLDAMTAPEPGPYLCRLSVVQCSIPINLKDIRTTAGDLNAADLEEALRPHIELIANSVKREVGPRSTIVFTPDVGSAMAIASALQSISVSASWVSGDDRDRAEKIADYKAGRVQVLCNCSLLTEGFDAPRTAAIVLCRPTKSRALYAQMIGRGTRLHPGKEDCVIVDFEWICGRHQLVKPVALLAGRLTEDDEAEEDVRRRATSLLDDGEESDLLDAIERAKADREESEKRKLIRLGVREQDLKYRRVKYDPLAAYHAIGLPTKFPAESRPQPATEKQLATLKKLGIPVPESISKRRASLVLDVAIGRIKQDKPSYKQVNALIANGVEPARANAMTFKEASRTLDEIFGARRRTG